MHNPPLVTIIIPTYNRAGKVEVAVNSVLRQTYANVQVIVVDDGSTDNTSSILENYGTVEYLRVAHGGQGRARNHGLRIAKGKYIASLDSDDVWNEQFLEKCVEKMECQQLDFVFTNWMQQLGSGEMVDRFTICEDLNSTLGESSDEWIILNSEKLRKIYLTGCPSPSSSLLVRRSSMDTQWESEFRIADDWSMLMSMIFKRPCTAAFTREILWSKYLDGQNIYDGKKFTDLTGDFWVHDKGILFSRIKLFLSEKEIKAFEKHYVLQIVNLAYHHMVIYKQFRISFTLIYKALLMNSFLVFSTGFTIFKGSKTFNRFMFPKYSRKTPDKMKIPRIYYKKYAENYNEKVL